MFLLIASASFAEDYVVTNSMDGRDVLTGVFYAKATDSEFRFMPRGGSPELFCMKVGTDHDILLIESSNFPISGYLKTKLESNGNNVEVLESEDPLKTNLDLAVRSDAERFIVVDPSYSDSALSVMPYAARSSSYVIFADKDNIDQVKEIVSGSEDLIIFGLVDDAVREELSVYNPEIIGEGSNRYEDNLLIVDKMMKEYNTKSVILDRGLFLETSMYSGNRPIVLTGRIVPEETRNYLKENFLSGELSGSLVVDRELFIPMQDLGDELEEYYKNEKGESKGFGVLVKFGQATQATGSGVYPLDVFPLPAYVPSLEVRDAVYNSNSEKIEITVENTGEGSASYSNEFTISVDGNPLDTLIDEKIRHVESGEVLGSEYAVDLSGVEEGSVTVSVICRYGHYEESLDNFDFWEGNLTTITYQDHSNLTIKGGRYDKENDLLLLTVKNNGDKEAYFKNAITFILDGEKTKLKGNVRSVDALSVAVDEIPLELSPEDIESNENITVDMSYGEREGYLKKEGKYAVELENEEFPILFAIILIPVLLLIIIIAAYIGWRILKKGWGQ